MRLVVAGDGPERARLQALVQRYVLEARVEFLGHLPKDRLAEVYRDASVLVLPSDTEALGNVVLEAMASGLAIITTRTGASELIDGNGQVIEARNPASIKAAIECYLSNPELLAEHQRMSRMLAQAMSWQSVARDLLTIWSEVTERAPGPDAAGRARPGQRRDSHRAPGEAAGRFAMVPRLRPAVIAAPTPAERTGVASSLIWSRP